MTAAGPTWPGLLTRLLRGEDLDTADTGWAMRQVMTGEASPTQVAGFLVALRAKGESAAEVAGLAATMVELATPVTLPVACVDIVGTGGDGAHTVNISTMAAIVTAATGVPVAKHGNRAASSQSGTADVLEALGVVIDLPAPAVVRCVQEAGIGFFFAPVFHPGAAAIGCSDTRMAPVLAEVLARRGTRALVFRGDDGLDELTTTTTSAVWVVRDGEVLAERLDPTALGLPLADPGALRGGGPEVNAEVVRRLVAGDRGPVRDAVLLNAAAALAAFDERDARLHDALGAALQRAADAIDDGRAAAKLEEWVRVSRAARG
jgi:anthranilate phosphoribosyltransferase